MTPLELIIRLGVVQTELALHREHAIERAAEMVESEAKGAIGTYKYDWPALADSTLAQKAGDTPLLERGDLRESIEHQVAHTHRQSDADIGSNSEIAVYQTHGTSRGIPPRPFMEPAAIAQEEKIHELFHGVVKQSFEGH